MRSRSRASPADSFSLNMHAYLAPKTSFRGETQLQSFPNFWLCNVSSSYQLLKLGYGSHELLLWQNENIWRCISFVAPFIYNRLVMAGETCPHSLYGVAQRTDLLWDISSIQNVCISSNLSNFQDTANSSNDCVTRSQFDRIWGGGPSLSLFPSKAAGSYCRHLGSLCLCLSRLPARVIIPHRHQTASCKHPVWCCGLLTSLRPYHPAVN